MPPVEQDALIYGPIRVELLTHKVLAQGKFVRLAKMEYRLLCYLILHEGQVLSRQEILTNIWNLPPNVKTRTLDMLSLFNEKDQTASMLAFVLALILDACPSLAGLLLSRDSLRVDKKATMRRIVMLLAAAVGAYLLFCGFSAAAITQQLPTINSDSDENPTAYKIAQTIRVLMPLVTSIGSFGISWKTDHQAQLEELKSTRRNLQDLRLEVENSIRSGERALEVYDPDSMDYQFACTRLHTLHLAAKESRIAVRMKLVEALGSVESAETLLQEVGISSDIIDEEAIKSQLMPPTIPSAAVLHSYDASQTAEADRFSIAS